jgi:hypothetical protein
VSSPPARRHSDLRKCAPTPLPGRWERGRSGHSGYGQDRASFETSEVRETGSCESVGAPIESNACSCPTCPIRSN